MSTPQATFTIPGSEQGPSAPSGTKQFDRDEQVDFHKSDLPLTELTRVATELATPMHQVSEADTKDIDSKRVEFGGNVVTTLAQEFVPQVERSLVDPIALAEIGRALVFLRMAQARDGAVPREN